MLQELPQAHDQCAGIRHRVTTDRSMLWKGAPYKALCDGMSKSGGRNHSGQTTVWHRGGGARKVYRRVDFTRSPVEAMSEVLRLEWDPNRSAHIALLRQLRTEGNSAIQEGHHNISGARLLRSGTGCLKIEHA